MLKTQDKTKRIRLKKKKKRVNGIGNAPRDITGKCFPKTLNLYKKEFMKSYTDLDILRHGKKITIYLTT